MVLYLYTKTAQVKQRIGSDLLSTLSWTEATQNGTGNANDYTPGFVAIGPLHDRGDRRLRPAELLKVAYLNGLISRGHPDPARNLAVIQDYVRIVAAREPEARAMYAREEAMDIGADDFILMMVLDGCFIIEHLLNIATGRDEPSLHMHATPFAPRQLSVDLILAENQMPFFVLVDLIKATKLPEFQATGFPPPVLLVKLVLFYLAGEKGRDMSDDALPAADGVSHILHLLYEMVTAARTRWEEPPPPPRAIQDGGLMKTAQDAARLLRRLPLLLFVLLLYPILPEDRQWSAGYGAEDVPSASHLKRMGVQLRKARGGGSGSKPVVGILSVLGPVPLAVKLTQNVERLHLPELRLEFRTAPLLLNLMAFEQSSSSSSVSMVVVSAYVAFMAKLVQSAEDARLLVEAEVLQQRGNESMEQIARFFRVLSEATRKLDYSYLSVTIELLRCRSDRWVNVDSKYFTFLAQVLTLVTFISGVCTVIQTYVAFKYHS